MLTSLTGPLVVTGQPISPISGQPPPDYNADLAPSLFSQGVMLLDPRATQGVTAGFYMGGDIIAIDQVPSTITTANIAALANVTAATPMTLVSSSGAGITLTTTATVIAQTGKTVPAGVLCIDAVPAAISFGSSGAVTVLDPRKSVARAISITAAASAVGMDMTVVGYDLYGVPMTETITVAAGAATSNGKKAFKFVTSVTPASTDAHNYSVGLSDIYGFPIAVYDQGAVSLVWNSIGITAVTGWLAADATTATATTGDVRGTYAVQSASDGAKRLALAAAPVLTSIQSNPTTGLFGVAQYAA